MSDHVVAAAKLRHRLTRANRFERAIRRNPGEDPVFPILMHGFERYLGGVKERSALDQVIKQGLDRHPILLPHLETWLKNWKETPDEVKARFVPPELRTLSAREPIKPEVFERLAARLIVGRPTQRPPAMWAPHAEVAGRIGLPLEPAANVTGTDPCGIDYEAFAYLGQQFTLTGNGFSANNSDNRVIIYNLVNDAPASSVVSHPVESHTDRLVCLAPLPNSAAPGKHLLQVTVRGHLPSEPIVFWLHEPPAVPAQVTGTVPASQYPGKSILINGSGFGQEPRVWWKSASLNDAVTPMDSPQVVALSATQLQATVPEQLVREPGDYFIAVTGKNQGASNWVSVKVLPYKYKVTFQTMTCIDESDPEWCGDDEIVTRWVVSADSQSWSKGTGEYGGFSDGDVKSYAGSDRDVFVPGDGPGEVHEQLSVGTMLLEWDAGDAKEWNSVLDSVADIAAKIPGVGTMISWILKALGKLIAWFGGDPDNLGAIVSQWTADDLYQKTQATGSFTDTAAFLNDDDTGSYRLAFVVDRVPI